MKLLVTGGAGYVGSHMVKYAQKKGHEVIVIDNFSTGHKWAVQDCEVANIDLLDKASLSKFLKGRYFDGVTHFAAKSIVSDSIKEPNKYYQTNVVGSLNLIDEMLKNNINNLVFSSSAAIFGNPILNKISENHPKNPINPYGKSKLVIENILEDYSKAFKINATCFRYFNAAGADLSGEIGEFHDPETHLIPNVLKSALNKNSKLSVYGNDYDTKDGTCIRDFIHVTDLAKAHLLGHEKDYRDDGNFSAYNLGNGNGFSVLDVIKSSEEIVGNSINFEIEDKRKGDPPILVADSVKAHKELNWDPKYKRLNEIIESAWRWHKKNFIN